MQLQYTTRDGRFTVTLDGKAQTDLIEQLAQFQDVFEVGPCTRNGKTSDKVKFQVREVDDNKFYELICTDTDPDLRNARLSFGQHKKGGTLFVKKKDKDDKWLPNNGWVRYNKESGKEE